MNSFVGQALRQRNRIKVISKYSFVEGDIHWTSFRVVHYPLYCAGAGVAAGLLGIGGGMVKGPLMLEMGILPQVQSTTAAFMIIFTSSSTVIQYAIAGGFPGGRQWDYILWYMLIGFSGGFTGQQV